MTQYGLLFRPYRLRRFPKHVGRSAQPSNVAVHKRKMQLSHSTKSQNADIFEHLRKSLEMVFLSWLEITRSAYRNRRHLQLDPLAQSTQTSRLQHQAGLLDLINFSSPAEPNRADTSRSSRNYIHQTSFI